MIHITLSPEAKQRLSEEPYQGKAIKLVYDSEGCGCAVSGVPSLWLLEAPGKDDLVAEGESPVTICYEQRHEIFFEPKLKLGYNEARSTFSLSSDGQIYNPSITIKTTAPATK
ncbi:iron-sulfur cluster biosynthesis family protein [Paenibacillus turpanensis]|uniref:iron-sulfur cluster biosynthesis family protein n=1 Tax=Paenibacillus turpanensis TaxID=2689078 RepID=UPI00140CD693|nr:iron-sulfur cluster biosynthesis family protein [Paenibacillus turpanensis]